MEQIAEVADTLSHDDLLEVTKSSLANLLQTDSLLSDLPSDIILEEIMSLTAVEHGQSISIYIHREDEPQLKVIGLQALTKCQNVPQCSESSFGPTRMCKKLSTLLFLKKYCVQLLFQIIKIIIASCEQTEADTPTSKDLCHLKIINCIVTLTWKMIFDRLYEPIKKVPQNATVRDLKKAIARHFEIYQQRTGNKVKISWKYIWRTYDLSFDSLILDDENSCIANYGVTNKVTLSYRKKRKKPKI